MQEKCAIWECSTKTLLLELELKFNSVDVKRWSRKTHKNLAARQLVFMAKSCHFTLKQMSRKSGGSTFPEAVLVFNLNFYWSKIISTGLKTMRCYLQMANQSQVPQTFSKLVELSCRTKSKWQTRWRTSITLITETCLLLQKSGKIINSMLNGLSRLQNLTAKKDYSTKSLRVQSNTRRTTCGERRRPKRCYTSEREVWRRTKPIKTATTRSE